MKTSDKITILSAIVTRDSAGRHFTEKFTREDLDTLEADGLITITRPVHPTGIPYDESYWSVEVTEAGIDLVDSNPEFGGR